MEANCGLSLFVSEANSDNSNTDLEIIMNRSWTKWVCTKITPQWPWTVSHLALLYTVDTYLSLIAQIFVVAQVWTVLETKYVWHCVLLDLKLHIPEVGRYCPEISNYCLFSVLWKEDMEAMEENRPNTMRETGQRKCVPQCMFSDAHPISLKFCVNPILDLSLKAWLINVVINGLFFFSLFIFLSLSYSDLHDWGVQPTRKLDQFNNGLR